MPSAQAADGGGVPGPIAERFGTFEPRFYGVSMILETPALYRGWIKMMNSPDGRVGDGLPPFEAVCLETVIDHEMRHFHDALISPFANALLRLRLMGAFNGQKAFNRAVRLGARHFPTPARKWAAMNHAERDAWLDDLVEDLGVSDGISPIPYPLPSDAIWSAPDLAPGGHDLGVDDPDEEIRNFVKYSLGAYDGAAAMMRGEAKKYAEKLGGNHHGLDVAGMISPRGIFEASAVAVQLQAAWTNCGEEAFEVLRRHVMSSTQDYARTYQLLAQITSPPDLPGLADPARISAAAIWCLLGDRTHPEILDPTTRLVMLMLIALKGEGITDMSSIPRLWTGWEERLQLSSWYDALIDLEQSTDRLVNDYRKIRAQGEPDFATVLESYQADQKIAIELMLSETDAYVQPHRYLTDGRDRLPPPLISVELGETFVGANDGFIDQPAIRIPWKAASGWNRLVMDTQAPPRGNLLDAALALEFGCGLSDLMFSDEPLRPVERHILLAQLHEQFGLSPLNVF